VLDAPGDVKLAVMVGAVVTGAHPVRVIGGALGAAALVEALYQAVVEGRFRLVGTAPVSDAHVGAVQPDLADVVLGLLRTRLRIDDHGPLAHRYVAAADLGDRRRLVGGDRHHPPAAELVAVDVDDAGLFVRPR